MSEFITDARAAHAVFSTMSTRDLRDLAGAFRLDLERAILPDTIAFCGGRLALAILKTRRPTFPPNREIREGST
jgi:hypothetical protein